MSSSRRKLRRYGSPEAQELHRLFPPIDLHAHPLLWTRAFGYDIGKRHRPPFPKSVFLGHTDLPRLLEAGMGGQFFTVAAVPGWRFGLNRIANGQIDKLEQACEKYPDLVMLASSYEDVMLARSTGRVAALIGIEGAHLLQGKIENLIALAQRRVRYLGLVHFTANHVARPAHGIGCDDSLGLSEFGREVVRECERWGIIVDLAHINRMGFLEVCDMARQPVMVSHTGVLGAHEHWRNIDDDLLRAVAETGGVIGIVFAPAILGGKGLGAIVRHVQHVIDVVGDEHVALGSDFDCTLVPPVGLKHVSMLPNLTDAFLRTGWSRERIGRILCRNVLRVLRDVKPAV